MECARPPRVSLRATPNGPSQNKQVFVSLSPPLLASSPFCFFPRIYATRPIAHIPLSKKRNPSLEASKHQKTNTKTKQKQTTGCTLGHYEMGVVTEPVKCLGQITGSQYPHSAEAGISYYYSGWSGGLHKCVNGRADCLVKGEGWQKGEKITIRLDMELGEIEFARNGKSFGKMKVDLENTYYPALSSGGSGGQWQIFTLSFDWAKPSLCWRLLSSLLVFVYMCHMLYW